MEIKDWYWTFSIDGDTLLIYVIDENDNEYLASEISECRTMSAEEIDKLVNEILFNDLGYKEV